MKKVYKASPWKLFLGLFCLSIFIAIFAGIEYTDDVVSYNRNRIETLDDQRLPVLILMLVMSANYLYAFFVHRIEITERGIMVNKVFKKMNANWQDISVLGLEESKSFWVGDCRPVFPRDIIDIIDHKTGKKIGISYFDFEKLKNLSIDIESNL